MRNELIALAESIDAARIEANRITVTAAQDRVYGDLVTALKGVLALLVGQDSVEDLYQSILDGNLVREALVRF